MKLFKAPGSNPVEQANFYHFVMDIAWYGIALTATTRFMQVFAIRLHASPVQIAFITSLPAICALLSSVLLSNWWRSRFNNSVKAVMFPATWQRFVFLLPALAPFFPPNLQPIWLIISICLPAVGEGIAAVMFLAMFREVTPDKVITRLLSYRSLAMNTAIAIGAVGFGIWLEKAPFPLNYQVMFVVAFLAAVMSLWHVLHIRAQNTPLVPVNINSNARPWRSPKFQKVAFAVVVTHIAFMSVFALTPLRLIRDMGATEGFMAVFGLMELVAGATAAMLVDKIVARLGNNNTMALAITITGISSLLMAFAPHLSITLIAGFLSGAGWTLTGITLFGYFTQQTRDVPPQEMTRYTGAFYQTVAISVFIGPLLGSTLANAGINLVPLLIAGAVLRFVAGLLARRKVVERVALPTHNTYPASASGD